MIIQKTILCFLYYFLNSAPLVDNLLGMLALWHFSHSSIVLGKLYNNDMSYLDITDKTLRFEGLEAFPAKLLGRKVLNCNLAADTATDLGANNRRNAQSVITNAIQAGDE